MNVEPDDRAVPDPNEGVHSAYFLKHLYQLNSVFEITIRVTKTRSVDHSDVAIFTIAQVSLRGILCGLICARVPGR